MPGVGQTYDASNLRNHTLNTAVGLTIVQDTLSGPKAVYRFANPNTAGTTRGHGSFIVAPHYLNGSSVILRVQYRADANSGALGASCTFTVKNFAVAGGTGSAVSPTSTTGTTVPGTAGNIGELVFTLAGSNFTSPRMHWVAFYVQRATVDTATGGSGNLDILSYEVEYPCDITFTKQYAYIPASVWQNLAGSPATLGAPSNNIDTSGFYYPYCYQMPDSAGNALGFKYTLPSTYTGNLKYYELGYNPSSANLNLDFQMGEAAVGSSFDPTLTSSAFTGDNTSSFILGNGGAGRSAPISPAAGSTISIKHTRDNADTSTGIWNFFGLVLEYDVFTASPCPVIQFNPTSLAPPTSNAASLLAVNDTNNGAYIVRFTQGQDQKIAGKRQNPGIYSSGGTFVGYVKTGAGSGNLKFHIEFINPAVGAASDAATTTSSTVSVPVTGANQILRFTIDISSGLVASDVVEALIVREGSTDAVAADADYINGWLEVGVLP